MKIGGLDVGTTGCKLTVFDEKGGNLGKAYRSYPVKRNLSGHEIDAKVLLECVFEVVSEAAKTHPDLSGIGVTSFGETFVLTDESGEPLFPAMLYSDPRGAEECNELTKKLGEEKIIKITGLRPHEMYSISKLVWIKNNKPEIYSKAKHIFLMEDYVVWALSGKAQIDYSLASRTMAFDISALDWSGEILQAAGIERAMFSRPVRTGSVAGTVTKEAAARTGLSDKCRIVSISHDQISAAVGAGVFDGKEAVDGAGTVECLTPIYDSLPDTEVMSNGYFSAVPYVEEGKYAAYAFSYTGGALLQWCVEKFAGGEKEKADAAGLSINEYLERAYGRDEPSGLLVLPHFAGAATPYMDNGSRGAIIGLDTETDLPTLYRACMEGVVYEMRLNFDALNKTGAVIKKINATGGGAGSKVWMQMKADVLGVPVTSLETKDAGTVGSAMLTGCAIGLFKDLKEAARVMVREVKTYYPRPEMHEKYEKIYSRYRKVYDAVRPLV